MPLKYTLYLEGLRETSQLRWFQQKFISGRSKCCATKWKSLAVRHVAFIREVPSENCGHLP
jgi:hypothetical protein